MSRIAKYPVDIPAKVEVALKGGLIEVRARSAPLARFWWFSQDRAQRQSDSVQRRQWRPAQPRNVWYLPRSGQQHGSRCVEGFSKS